ncbi:MAG: cytochrome c [Gammaproteobacteria bacterium]|nr:cytochrome c [Gammaproteobacteria bacterium]
MTRRITRWPTAAAAILAVAACGAGQPADRAGELRIETGDAQQLRLGEQLYALHCASCHGAQLEGAPDWRRRLPSGRLPAPPHDASGHTWHHPDWELFAMTKHGVTPLAPPDYETDMPAFGDILSDAEILAVLGYIKAQWPDEIAAIQEDINQRAPPPPDISWR